MMYRVIWEIDIDEVDPKAAAQKALDIQRDPESIATVFIVMDESGKSALVDLWQQGTP